MIKDKMFSLYIYNMIYDAQYLKREFVSSSGVIALVFFFIAVCKLLLMQAYGLLSFDLRSVCSTSFIMVIFDSIIEYINSIADRVSSKVSISFKALGTANSSERVILATYPSFVPQMSK
ncbi:hypothetical protein BDF21DRAFT_396688 [Thamnidium elegans]|nr:hypothetical protein BDF21DRAFT_396688 [Thamnidium elegans]